MLLAKTLIKRIISNTIFEAKDGNEAVEVYSKEKPDVILMDIQMPNKMVMKLPMKSDSFKMQRIFLYHYCRNYGWG
jgi:YesN/AraC family two-component response regulator